MQERDEKKAKDLSQKIKDCKARLGLNHTNMAALLGYSRDSYIKWYDGTRVPREDTYLDVIDKLEKAME
jgi:DNA-binding XRE family transcriptional regulator